MLLSMNREEERASVRRGTYRHTRRLKALWQEGETAEWGKWIKDVYPPDREERVRSER